MDDVKVPFGLADVYIGTGADQIRFDGIDFYQADGGSVELTPELEDINIADFGNSVWDQYSQGYTGSATIVAATRQAKLMYLALGAVNMDDDGGITDAKINTSMRSKAKPVRIHPRYMGDDNSSDIYLFKAASTEGQTLDFANEQGNLEIQLSIYPRDGANPNDDGNFFYIGEDPPSHAWTEASGTPETP